MSDTTSKLPGVDILKWVATLGLGTVLAVFGWKHLTESDRSSDQFLREQLMKAMVEDAKASTEAAYAMNSMAAAVGDLAVQTDDLGDEQRKFNKSLERFWTVLLSRSPIEVEMDGELDIENQ